MRKVSPIPSWFFFVGALVLLAAGLWVSDRMNRIKKWPRSDATVHHIESYVTVGRRGGKSVEYRLRFSFTVAGRTYEHKKVVRPTRFTGGYWLSVQEGSQIEVAYNPADPTTAVLVEDPNNLPVVVWTAALVFASVWILHGLFLVRARLKKRL